MSIGQKLSDLRKSKHLSQEDVADRLGVTRQTISKWETDQSTPDFDKIIPICELFGLSSDELLGNLNSNDNKDKKGESPSSMDIENKKENNIRKRKKAIGISLGVLFYFLSVIWIMISIPVMKMNPIVASAVFLLICGIATFVIVYSCMFYSKDKREKEKEEELNPNKKLAKQVNEIISLIILIIYLVISFTTFAWHITWIIWIVYGLIEQIVNLIFDLRGESNEK
ncbi:MAG: helix-turn-helix domain-containing protein [Bacilli bacterium]|nr:helix-turn-helix domain-containing protein [Bacilli bacterium]